MCKTPVCKTSVRKTLFPFSRSSLALMIALLVGGLGALTAGGASTARADEAATNAPPAAADPKTCFWLSDIRDFRGLDTRHVWVRGPGQKRQYLLTLFSSCTSLPFAQTIALSTKPTQRLCSNANEFLILVDQGVGNRRCMITTVERVDSLAQARAIAKEREDARRQARTGPSDSD